MTGFVTLLSSIAIASRRCEIEKASSCLRGRAEYVSDTRSDTPTNPRTAVDVIFTALNVRKLESSLSELGRVMESTAKISNQAHITLKQSSHESRCLLQAGESRCLPYCQVTYAAFYLVLFHVKKILLSPLLYLSFSFFALAVNIRGYERGALIPRFQPPSQSTARCLGAGSPFRRGSAAKIQKIWRCAWIFGLNGSAMIG